METSRIFLSDPNNCHQWLNILFTMWHGNRLIDEFSGKKKPGRVKTQYSLDDDLIDRTDAPAA
jgi:hypothetical protein